MSKDECEDCRSMEGTIQDLEGVEDGLTRDITELKNMVAELEETVEKLRTALDEIQYLAKDALK